MYKKVACLAFVGAVAASSNAFAVTDTQTMAVSATISSSCTLATTPLNFGGALTSTTTADTDVLVNATVTCTNDSPFNVGIDNGLNFSGGRRMSSGANFLPYTVSVDAFGVTSYTAVGTFGTTGNFNSALTGITGANTVAIYGQIPQQVTSPASGTYTDTLTVTVNY
jgi:spore coat protein U-like protein